MIDFLKERFNSKLILLSPGEPNYEMIETTSKKIFNGQTRNFWDMDDIMQTGIKAILYTIKSFDIDRSEGFTTVVCLNISKYLNKKKTNYDPMLQLNKGCLLYTSPSPRD